MQLVTALIYWVAVSIWLAVLTVVAVHYIRNPRIFGTTRLLLFVVAIDTCRNLVENVYFGLLFGGRYELFPAAFAQSLGNPSLLALPKMLNVISGCLVLGLLLMRWLPQAVTERGRSDQLTADLELLASLLNRRHIESLARAEWARFQRYGRPLLLMLLDIDIKSVNDRFGHDTGDLVIKAVAHICKSTKRQPDVLAGNR
jgi:GGDEF domain-containing protein